MSKVLVYDMKGQEKGSIEIPDNVLVLDKGEDAVHQVVTAQLAARHQGTVNTLRKGEVAGSNKKPWKQKGTGQARAGYRQSPVWRGGGVAFGPHPRSFEQKVTRKMRNLAFRRALSERISGGALTAIEGLKLEKPKTREVAGLLKALKASGPVLLVTSGPDLTLVQASRNLPGVEVVAENSINTYQVVRYPRIIASKDAVEKFKERLAEGGAGN